MLESFIVRSGHVVGTSTEPTGFLSADAGRPLAPKAPSDARGLSLPMANTWRLPRSSPRILEAPAELDGSLYLLSDGVLECVEATARGAVRWRRAMPPGAGRARWADGRLVMTFPGRALALDGKTGKLLWDRPLPFTARQLVMAPPHVFIGMWDRDRRYWRMACLDLATGATEWENDLRELPRSGYDGVRAAIWDGRDRMVLFARLTYDKKPAYFTLPMSLKDGRLLEMKKFREGEDWGRLFAADARGGFYIDSRKQCWGFTLDGGTKHTRYNVNFGSLADRPEDLDCSLDGSWFQVRQVYYPSKRQQWIVKRGDTKFEWLRERFGTMEGNRLYDRHDNTLVVLDVPNRKEVVRYTVGAKGGRKRRVDILEHQTSGGRVMTVTGVYGGRDWDPEPEGLRLDLFEEKTGRRIAEQPLDGPVYWRLDHSYSYDYDERHQSQAFFRNGALFLTDMHGVWAYVPEPQHAPEDLPRPVVYRVNESPALDGALTEWDGAATVPLRGKDGRTGTLKLIHDDRSLFLAVTCPDRDPRPRVGRGDFGGGDWLELALTTRDGSYRWGLGLDPAARPVWESLHGTRSVDGLRAGIRHDAVRDETVYELGIPFDAIVRRSSSWQRMRLSLTVWDEVDRSGPQEALAWGGAIDGRILLPTLHEEIYVDPATIESEGAAEAIVRQLPEYGIGWDILIEASRHRCRRPYSRVVIPQFVRLMKSLRDGFAAQRVLVILDRLLRSSPDDDPSPEILKLAEQAGVSAAVRQRYARLTRSRLSVWVYVDPKKPPRTLMLRLCSEHGDRGWYHRVYWGRDEWDDHGRLHTPSRRFAGPVPEAGKWQELRIPLIWLAAEDRPIHGVSFWTHEGRATWDRFAIQYEGGERLLIEDKTPEGREENGWRWVSDPHKSGGRAFTSSSDESRLSLSMLAEPVYEHLVPPLAGPHVSQWVWLDPKQPPKSIDLSVNHRGSVEYRPCWGKPLEGRVYAGPLPPLGRWHELRVPLDGTPVAGVSISGFGFGQDGGRVVWDRTAIVAGKREQVLIDDDVPTGARDGDWQWVDDPVRSGKKAHTEPVRGGYHAHAQSHWQEHVTLHMSTTLDQKMAILTEQIPKLGASEAAYDVFAMLLRTDAGTQEHYATVFRWFVTTFPNHKRTPEMLSRLYEFFRNRDAATAAKAMSDLFREAGIPRSVRYAFNVSNATTGPAALRNWRVLGPFPNIEGKGHDRAYPPETEPVNLAKAYEGIDGAKVRWKPLNSDQNIITLDPHFTPNDNAVAYAVCWVKMERGSFASLEIGSDDGCKVWVNDRLVLDRNVERSLEARTDQVRAYFKTGWNRILFKCVETIGEWQFIVELFDSEGRSLLPSVRVSTTPPRD